MDLYKKKSLKFSGMSRGVRCAELDAARRSSRLQRFSLLRPIEDDDDVPKENVPSSSKIPTLGKQKSQIPSRADMLKKWKEEKMLKKKLEEQTKKPTFKPGGFVSKLQPPLSNRFGDLSKIQESSFQSFNRKPTPNCSVTKGFQSSRNISSVKTSNTKSKDFDSKSIPIKSQASDIKSQASKSKINVAKPPTARSQALGMIPPARNLKTDNITLRNSKPPTITKPVPKEKSKDSCVPSYTKPKVPLSNLKPSIGIASDPKAGKKILYSGITKPSVSLLPQRKQQPVPSKTIKPATSNPAPARQTGTVFRKPAEKPKLGKDPKKEILQSGLGKEDPKKEIMKSGLGKEDPKKEILKSGLGKKEPKKEVEDISASKNLQGQFDLNEAENSFAPKGFVFRPPVELQVSWFSDDGPFSIFERLKNENPRTSTPKRSEFKECEELGGSFIVDKDTCSVRSSGTKFVELLLDNSLSEINLPVPNFLPNKPSELSVLEVSLQKENHKEILPKVKSLEAKQSGLSSETAVLDEIHPKPDATEANKLASELFCTASSDTTDYEVFTTETEQSRNEFCLPEQNKTETDTSVHLAKNSPLEIPPHCSLQQEQITSESCLPVKDLASNAILELDLPLNNRLDSFLTGMGQTVNFSSAICSTVSNLEEDKMGSQSDSMLLGQAVSYGTKSKRLTRRNLLSEKPLLKISESPEIQETPKSVRRAKTLERATAAEFTPRRSRRLAGLSEFNSEENLFDIRESLYSSPGPESSQLTYDFDKLHLESKDTSEVFHRYSTRSSTVHAGKVSLLYTPPRTRKSIRKTVKGDLMSFSPSV